MYIGQKEKEGDWNFNRNQYKTACLNILSNKYVSEFLVKKQTIIILYIKLIKI